MCDRDETVVDALHRELIDQTPDHERSRAERLYDAAVEAGMHVPGDCPAEYQQDTMEVLAEVGIGPLADYEGPSDV